jgi:hypothetical protein
MPSLASIDYIHAISGFGKGLDSQGPYYNVEYLISDWDNGDAFANALCGIGQSEPHRYPLSTNLVCTSAVVSGRGRVELNNDGYPRYQDGARIVATYRSSGSGLAYGGSFSNVFYDDPGYLHQIDSSTPLVWCTQELDFGVESFAMPNTSYTWDSDNTSAQIPVVMDVNVTTMSLTFHRRSSLPMGTVRALRGRINDATFLGAAVGTVLFVGAQTTREASTDGTVTQRVRLLFKERDVSWNKFLRPGKMPGSDANWDFLEDSGGNRRFKVADLSPLVAIP